MLEFPTMAERAIADWKVRGMTTAFEHVAKGRGAFRHDEQVDGGRVIIWIFDDDTKVRISGRGNKHKIEAELP